LEYTHSSAVVTNGIAPWSTAVFCCTSDHYHNRKLGRRLHFFFLPPLRFGRLESFSPAALLLLSAAASSAGRFFSAALAKAFSRSFAMSSVNFALMSLLSP